MVTLRIVRTAVLVMALVTAALLPSTAGAAPSTGRQSPVGTLAYQDCGIFRFCGWDGLNATGFRMEWSGTINCGDTKDLRRLGWGHRIESVMNNTTTTLTFYEVLPNGNWLFLFHLVPGQWGNLEPIMRNRVDLIQRHPLVGC
jgi:hypothetical protein